MRKYLVIFMAFLAVVSISLAPPAKAEFISLALVMDGSGSISAAEFALQKQGYANALNALLPADSTIGLSVVQFSSSPNSRLEIAYNVIDTAAEKTAFISALLAIPQIGANTAISAGIETGLNSLAGAGSGSKKIIDVSTDGAWNVGVNPAGPAGTTGTALWAVANGASQVNVLGVGVSTPIGWNAGTDSFSILAVDFAAFGAAIKEKLEREIIGVPEPGTMLLLGSGLIGLWGFGRKRMKM